MKGLVAVARSRAAILGLLAAGAAGLPRDRKAISTWLEERGLAIGERGLRDAQSARLRRPGISPNPLPDDPADSNWVWESLDFDPTRLDLDFAVVVFPPSSVASNLTEVLRSTERVVRIYRSYEGGIVACLAYEGARERQRLQTLLEEREPALTWLVVREVDDSVAADTWLALTRQVAAKEGLARE